MFRRVWKRRETQTEDIPDRGYYSIFKTGAEVFHAWQLDPDIAATTQALASSDSLTLVGSERLFMIKWAFLQTANLAGEVWEAGVYRGGSAHLMTRLALTQQQPPQVRLFDSFQGLPPPTRGVDKHLAGEFADTSLEQVRGLLGEHGFIDYRVGWIPATFSGLDNSRIRFAHIDLDMYQSTLDCLEFIYPRMQSAGIIVLDDYGLISCPGVRKAVDEFFMGKPESPLPLPSSSALLIKR
jgi:O-methyltransferase